MEAKAPWPGRETREVTLPWPTNASPQTRLASAEGSEFSLPSEQVERPLFCSLPRELIAKTIRSSFGGVVRSVVAILPPMLTATGASSVRGSERGEMPPLKEPWRLPSRTTSAWARAVAASRQTPAATATTRRVLELNFMLWTYRTSA